MFTPPYLEKFVNQQLFSIYYRHIVDGNDESFSYTIITEIYETEDFQLVHVAVGADEMAATDNHKDASDVTSKSTDKRAFC